MDDWKQYLFSIIACSVSCGIVTKILSDTKGKALIHLICGTVIAVCILRPLSKLNLENDFYVPSENRSMAKQYITDGVNTALEAQARCIKVSCEAYILDKAKTLGAEVIAQVSLNQDLIPVSVEIQGEADTNAQMELQKILTTDLGIPKENQEWIWNQESNSS